MIRAIAFDWGGVFTEGTFDSSAVANLAALYRVPQSQIAETYYPLMEAFEVGAFDFDGFFERFTARSGLETEAGLFRKTFLGSVRERSAMFAVLGAIPGEYRVGMLSNNVPVLCDRVRDDPRFHRVERFLFSNEIGARKPDPVAFHALTRALEVPPEATVFIDDNEGNIAACERLGFQGLRVDDFPSFLERWQRRFPDLAVEVAES